MCLWHLKIPLIWLRSQVAISSVMVCYFYTNCYKVWFLSSCTYAVVLLKIDSEC